jgi:outer membrane protein assembly factor BamB
MRRTAVLVTTVVLALVLAGCDWYQPGFNATNDGFSPTENAVSTANVSTLTKTWEHDSPAQVNAVGPRLAVADGHVFSSDSQGVLSIDAGTGALNWAASAPPDTATICANGGGADLRPYGPVVSGGVVYALGSVGSCLELGPSQPFLGGATIDESTGAETWTLGSWPTGTVISRGVRYTTLRVYVPPNLVASVAGSGGHGIAGGDSLAAVSATTMFATTQHLTLVAAPTSGASTAPLWTAPVSLAGSAATPSIDATHVYLTDGATVKAFDQATGAVVWSAALPATGSTDAPAVADGEVFVRTANSIVALDATTGATLWSGSLGTLGTTATGLGSPTIANGVVYVGSQDGKLLAFDAAGVSSCSGSPVVCTPLLSGDIGGAPGASRPVPANGSVFIGAKHVDGNEAVYKFSLPG